MRLGKDKMTDRAKEEDLKEIRELWDICFSEDRDFNDWFFEKRFEIGNVIVCREDNKIVSMLQRIEYMLYPIGKVSYIYGACTHPDYRKKHFMEKLLKCSEEMDRESGFIGSVLIPAEDWLFGFYEKYGFECGFYVRQNIFNNGENFTGKKARKAIYDDIGEMNRLYEDKLRDTVYIKRNRKEWINQIDMFNELGGDVFIAENGGISAFCFVWNKDVIWVQEIFAENDEEENNLMSYIREKYAGKEIKVTGKAEKEKGEKLGMIRIYSDEKINGYMNLMYN